MGYLKTYGFSLLELVIVIAVIAILSLVAIPRFSTQRSNKVDNFLASLNVLTQMAYTNAQVTGKLHRIIFDFKNDRIMVEIADGKNSLGEPVFQPLQSQYLKNFIPWPDRFVMNNFYIKGKDELVGSATTSKVWFYIVPDGVSQQIVMNITDQEDKHVSFVLNPFTALFKKI